MKKDVIICFKDGEMLCVSGTSAEDGISEMSTEEWIVCVPICTEICIRLTMRV